jgi:hypothetical protein
MILLLGPLLFPGQAQAQIGQEFIGDGSLFQATLNKPSNLPATMEYAVRAERQGDLEGIHAA